MEAKRSNRWLVIAMMLLALSMACDSGDQTSTPPPTAGLPGESQAYNRLMEKFLISRFSRPPELYPNELPEEIPLSIPVPEGGQLLGTTVINMSRDRKDVLVFIESPQTPSGAVAFYTERFAGMGWEEPQPTMYSMNAGQGFVEAGVPITKVFCPPASETGVGLEPATISVSHSTASSLTDIRIAIMQRNRGLGCEPMYPYLQDAQFQFPRLEAPSDANATGGSGSSSDAYRSTLTRIETDLSPTELEKHYRDQLTAQGWELLSFGESAGKALSTWLVTEEGPLRPRNWVGMLEVRFANDPSYPEDVEEKKDVITYTVSLQVITSQEEP